MDPLLGIRIGQIRIVDRLGAGGMGEVYVGYDEKLERKVAVKAVHRERRLEEQAQARLVQEAKILSKLEHPHICRVYDLVQDAEGDFIVMELLEGVSLREALKRELRFSEKLRFVLEISDALAVAHDGGVIHRDLKPENVMVTTAGSIKILDFGLAQSCVDQYAPTLEMLPFGQKDVSESMSAVLHTQAGIIKGTLRYMSPEQARGEPATPASDMYSFGLLMQEVFTRREPYPTGLTEEALLWRAMNAETVPVTGLDEDLRRLIELLKSESPVRRLTAHECANRLRWLIEKPKRRLRRMALAAFVTVLILGTTFSTIGFYRARQAVGASQEINRFLKDMLIEVDPRNAGIDLKVIDLLNDAEPDIDRDFADYALIRGDLHQSFGSVYHALGDYEKAFLHLDEAHRVRLNLFGAAHPETLSTRSEMSLVLLAMGRYEESLQVATEVHDACLSKYGANHPKTLNAGNNMATAMSFLGRYEEAAKAQRDLMQRASRVLGRDHEETLNIQHNLADTLHSLGEYAEVEELLRSIIEYDQLAARDEQPDHLVAVDGLGRTLLALGKTSEAVPLYRELVETSRRVMGPAHAQTLASINSLANCLSTVGDHAESEALLRDGLAVAETKYGRAHPETVSLSNSLAVVLSLQENYEEAIALLQDVLEYEKRRLGENHPRRLSTMFNYAYTLAKSGKRAEAGSQLRHLVGRCTDFLGTDHPLTLQSRWALVENLSLQGEHDEAVQLGVELVERSRQIMGVKHPFTPKCMNMVAKVLLAAGRYDEANSLENESHALLAQQTSQANRAVQ